MYERAIDLFKQSGEKAYALCKDHGHKVSDVDNVWVSIMSATLTELVIEEMYDFIMDESNKDNGIPNLGKVKEHFGIK